MTSITDPQTQAYIEKHWDVIAAFAWHEFKAHGRGAVVVQDAGGLKEKTIFIPRHKLEENPLGREYATLVCEYDPRKEAMIILLRPRSAMVYAGAASGREAPPEAYRRLGSVLFRESL
jgi:hypothetical protein